MRETYSCGYLYILKLKIYNCLYKRLVKLIPIARTGSNLTLVSGTHLCFFDSPWLCLISGIKGVQGDYIYSCHTLAVHSLPSIQHGCCPDVFSISHAAAPFECRTASHVPYGKCFSYTLHNSSNEQMTCAFCFL